MNISEDLLASMTVMFNIQNLEVLQSDPNIAFIVTTAGIFRTENLLDEEPDEVNWIQVFSPEGENFMKGLVFASGSSQVVYAAGKDIYRSMDQGDTWISITGPGTGLDFGQPPFNNGVGSPSRINLAVSPNHPTSLFALVNTGNNQSGAFSRAYVFDSVVGIWIPGDYIQSSSHTSPGWVALAACPDPAYPDLLYYGGLNPSQSQDLGQTVAEVMTGTHDDVQALEFAPNGTGELWMGTHGGLYVVNSPGTIPVYELRNRGLATNLVVGCSTNPTRAGEHMAGSFDSGTNYRSMDLFGPRAWSYLSNGDGAENIISPDGLHAWSWEVQSLTKYYRHTWPFSDYFSYGTGAPHGFGRPGWLAPWRPAMGFLPGTGQWYLATTDMYKEYDMEDSPTGPESYGSITGFQNNMGNNFPGPCEQQMIVEAAFAPSDDRIAYFATDIVEPSQTCPGIGSVLYRLRSAHQLVYPPLAEDAGEIQVQKIEFINDFPENLKITGIAVDPVDPTLAYVTFSGYDQNAKVLLIIDDYAYNMDAPPHSLPNLPVNDIVYQEGTAEGLYIAMDVGVFHYNSDTQEWDPYYEALPNVQVADLEINYCTGKLLAGTWGRGLWESDLAEKASVEKVVNTSQTWDFHRNLASDVRVAAGATLTIATTVNFAPGTRMIIDPGSKLIVESTGLLDNLCGEQWDGIEVRGIRTASQVPLTNQGYLELRAGAQIRHADIAIRLYRSDDDDMPDLNTTGGVVRAFGQSNNRVIINNCLRGLHMLPYENRPGGGIEINNRSSFAWTSFSTDEQNVEDFALLEDVSGITFSNCLFRYTDFSSSAWSDHQRPHGIVAYDSEFTARSCTFSRLVHGIDAGTADLLNPCYIRDNLFDNNDVGALLSGIYGAEVTGNTFLVPPTLGVVSQDPFDQLHRGGLYLEGCEGFEVEENAFSSTASFWNAGLILSDCNVGANQFYRNTFNNLYVGSLLQGDNRDEQLPNGGAQALCNTYGETNGCDYDIAVTTDEGAIAEYQGDYFGEHPAGNRFYPECDPATDPGNTTDIHVDEGTDYGFTYISHTDAECLPSCKSPDQYVQINVTFQEFQESGPQASCPENRSSSVTHPYLLKSMFAAMAAEYSELRALYEGQVDAGDTEELINYLKDATMSSFSLRTQLLAASPRLSDEVMIAAINRTPAMESFHVAQVLLANSPLSPDVRLTLEKSDMEPYYQSLVDAQQNGGLSVKSTLEAELGWLRSGAEMARADAVRRYLERDTVGNPMDSVLTLLYDPVLLPAPSDRLAALVSSGHFSAAEGLLVNSAVSGLHPTDSLLWRVLLNLHQDPAHAEETLQEAHTTLVDLSEDLNRTAVQARVLLRRYADRQFSLPFLYPGMHRSVTWSNEQAGAAQGWLRAYPVPANENLRIESSLPEDSSGGRLVLIDAQGRSLRQWTLRSGLQLIEADVSDLPNGMYQLRSLAGEHSYQAPVAIAR